MNDLGAFERRAAVARRHQPPTIDVTARVLSRLHHDEPPPVFRSLFVHISVASAVAAGLVLAAAIPMCMTWYDPMVCFLLVLSI